MKIFKLINNKTDECELIFVPVRDEDFTCALNGMLLEATSWGSDLTDSDFDFIADLSIKWDGCSHFRFFEQDCTGDTEDENCDSYYHICGFDSYIKHFRSMVFAWQLAINKLGDTFDSNYELPEYEEFKKHIDLLNGYEIEEEILKNEDSVLWYKLKDLMGSDYREE